VILERKKTEMKMKKKRTNERSRHCKWLVAFSAQKGTIQKILIPCFFYVSGAIGKMNLTNTLCFSNFTGKPPYSATPLSNHTPQSSRMLHVCNIASMTLSPLHTHSFPRTLYPHHHSPTLTITPPFSFSFSISSNSNFKKFPTLCTTPSSTTHPPLSPNYNETLLQLTQTSSFDSIKTLIKQMKSSGFTPNDVAFVTLIQSLTNFQEIEQVLNILENELGFYNLALNALVDDNKLKLVEMLHSKMVCEGIVLDVSTFNVLIKALCKAHQLKLQF
jgi:hypothetical protein